MNCRSINRKIDTLEGINFNSDFHPVIDFAVKYTNKYVTQELAK